MVLVIRELPLHNRAAFVSAVTHPMEVLMLKALAAFKLFGAMSMLGTAVLATFAVFKLIEILDTQETLNVLSSLLSRR